MMKELKQTFTSIKGNRVEIIATTITGDHPNDVAHTVKVNGKIVRDRNFSTTELLSIMKDD